MTFRLTLAMALVLASVAGSDAGETRGKPFPVNRTQIVKDGVVVVEGRVRIPVGIEITVQKNTKVIGTGDQPTIEVEGKLTVQGVRGEQAIFEDVTIELQPKFTELNV